MKSIYARMIEAGVETANHQSDLYVPVNDTTRQIIKEYNESVEPGYEVKPEVFVSKIDHTLWFDIPFMFDPYWESKRISKPGGDGNEQ